MTETLWCLLHPNVHMVHIHWCSQVHCDPFVRPALESVVAQLEELEAGVWPELLAARAALQGVDAGAGAAAPAPAPAPFTASSLAPPRLPEAAGILRQPAKPVLLSFTETGDVTLRLDNPTAGSTAPAASLVLNRDGVVICPEIPIGIGVPSLQWTIRRVDADTEFGFASACKAIGSLAQSPYSEVLKLRVPRALRVPTVFNFEGGRGALDVDTCQGALPAPTAVEVAVALNLAELDSAAPVVFPVVSVTETSQRCVLEGLEERGVYHVRCRVVFDQGPGAVGYSPWSPVGMMTNTVLPAAAAVARLELDEASSTYSATLSLDVRCITGSHAAQSVEVSVGGRVTTMPVPVGSPSSTVVIPGLSPGSQCVVMYRSVVPGAGAAQPWSLSLELTMPFPPVPAVVIRFQEGVASLSLQRFSSNFSLMEYEVRLCTNQALLSSVPIVVAGASSTYETVERLEESAVYHLQYRAVLELPSTVCLGGAAPTRVFSPWSPVVMMTNTVQPAAAAVTRLELDEASSTYSATLSLDVRCIAGSHAAESVQVNVGGEVTNMAVPVGSPSPTVAIPRLSPGSQCVIKYRSVIPGAGAAQPWSLLLELLLPSAPPPASYRGFERGVAVLSLSTPRSSLPVARLQVRVRVRTLHGGEPQISEHPVEGPSGDITVGVAVDPYGTCVVCVRGVVATASGPCLTPWSSEISFQPLPLPTITRVRYTGGGSFVILFRERVCGPAVVHSRGGKRFRVEDGEAPRREAIHGAAVVHRVGADNQLDIVTVASDGGFSVGAVDDSCGRSPTVEAKRHSGRWVRAASMA
jgi:hypothetical protein